MKKGILISVLIFSSIFFSGCSNFTKTTEANVAVNKNNGQESLVKIEITGEKNKTLNQKKELEIIQSAIKSAQKIKGILDVKKSNFEIVLIDSKNNKETFFLWLSKNDNEGMIMNTEDTHTGYKLKTEDVVKIKDLLNM